MSDQNRSRSRKNTQGAVYWRVRLLVWLLLAILLIGGAGTAIYLYKGQKYKEVFFPQTIINGIDASDQTVEEVKAKIAQEMEGYQLILEERGGEKEIITMKEIGLHSVFDGELERVLSEQNPNEWLPKSSEQKVYEIQTMIAYDEDAFHDKIKSLKAFQEENLIQPQDAYLSEYNEETGGYHIVPEVEGNVLDQEKTIQIISNAILNLKDTVNLDAEDCYVHPTVLEADESLQKQLEVYNKYASMSITLNMGEGINETIDRKTIRSWVTIREDLSVSVDEEAIGSYVKQLAKKYNTAYTKRKFKTTSGKTVEISKGDYGWRINQSAEKKALIEMIKSGEGGKRTVEYFQKGAIHSDQDWGNTYVEINLTAQHLYFYKDGKLLVESDFVSGNAAKKYDTPAGIYGITYTEKNAVLKGEDYNTPVTYWMPFNGNIGMHDATWRSSFGGTIYKTNGSHGCVNLPQNAAKIIFENIKKNDPVICYHLEGTESSKTSKPTEPSKPAETTKPTEAETSKPAETTKPTEVETSKPAETTKPTEAETSKPAETTKPTEAETSKPVEITRPTETETSKPVETTKPTEAETTKEVLSPGDRLTESSDESGKHKPDTDEPVGPGKN